MNRTDILERAIEMTVGPRADAYGDAVESMTRTAELFNAATGHKITPAQAALLLACVKMARMKVTPLDNDHYVDASAYIAMAYECAVAAKEKRDKEADEWLRKATVK